MRPDGGAASHALGAAEAGASSAAAADGHFAPSANRRTFRFRRRTAASNLSRQTYGAGGAAAGLNSVEASANVGMGLETDSTLLPPCYPREGRDQRLARTQGLRESLAITRACAEEAATEATAECVEAVSDFINGWGFGTGGGRHGDMGKNDLIPLAIVNAGLHLADRVWAAEKIRGGLAGTAQKSCSEVVVVLRCQECTTVPSTLSAIRVQCLALGGITSRRPLFMDSLGDWYDSMFPPDVAPGSRWKESTREREGEGSAEAEAGGGNPKAFAERGMSRRRPPVVVLIEDVEGMEKQVLRDVLTILAQPPVPVSSSSSNGPIPARGASGPRGGRCGRGVPLALVALASMGVGFPMERLSCSSARQVSVRHFALPSAAQCVDSLLQKLFVQGRLPVEMGSRAVFWMHRSFVESHQSLATVCRQIQRAMLEHFMRPASYICLQNCPAWLERLRYTNRHEEARAYFALTFMSDCRRMPPESLNFLLGGVLQATGQQSSLPSAGSVAAEEGGKTRPVLSQQQATHLVGKALADQATASLRLWFLHEVVTAVSDPRHGQHGEQEPQHQGQNRPPRSHGNVNTSPSHLMVLLARGSRAYFKEITKIAGALGSLPPRRVIVLLRRLLEALATARSMEESPSATSGGATAAPGGSSMDGQPLHVAQEGAAPSSTPRGRTCLVPFPNDTPPAVAGLDSREAAYLWSSAETLVKLWMKADDEGWAQPAGDLWMSAAVSAAPGVGGAGTGAAGAGGDSAVGGDSASATGDCGGVGRSTVPSSSSRGHRFLKRALDQGTAAFSTERGTGSDNNKVQDAEGPAPREPSRGNEQEHSGLQEQDGEREEALWRACLVRELQLLFLHVMGEARDCPLVEGEGAELPPPLSSKAILREGYCFDRPNNMQASLCPQGRAIIDEAMVTGARGRGAGAGTPRPSADSSGTAQDYPLSDTCLLYACYRGHGKVIDRSDWFADFRRAATRHNPPQQLTTGESGAVAAPATEKASRGHRASSDPAKLRARFGHASQELELLGYVKASKRRKRDKGGTSGPRGSVTRLVYAYTMEGGAL